MNNKELIEKLNKNCEIRFVAGYQMWIPNNLKLGVIETTNETLYFSFCLKFHIDIQIISIVDNFSKIIPIDSIVNLHFQ